LRNSWKSSERPERVGVWIAGRSDESGQVGNRPADSFFLIRADVSAGKASRFNGNNLAGVVGDFHAEPCVAWCSGKAVIAFAWPGFAGVIRAAARYAF
jgi:hypothetical protein